LGIDQRIVEERLARAGFNPEFDSIRINELNKVIQRRAGQGAAGTMLNLSPAEISQMAAADPSFAAQYRQSGFIRLFESKMSVGEDLAFVDDVKKLMAGNQAVLGFDSSTTVDDMFTTITQRVSEKAAGRPVNSTEIAYRIAGRFLNSPTSSDDLVLGTRSSMANLLNRQQFSSFAGDDRLGIYVNRLGFAASMDNQKFSAIQEMESMLEKGSDLPPDVINKIRSRLNALKTPSIAIYSPEAAIDPAISGAGGILRSGASPEELIRAIRAYISSARNRSRQCFC